jgi:hypothetical protein
VGVANDGKGKVVSFYYFIRACKFIQLFITLGDFSAFPPRTPPAPFFISLSLFYAAAAAVKMRWECVEVCACGFSRLLAREIFLFVESEWMWSGGDVDSTL